ncbi:MAG: NAD(P)/FAD-dependent oxidoreductase [Casimicrobiaceae bacterium]
MVIVGAGECGARAAFALRENGYSGAVTLIGAEPHLPYERPPLSKAVMVNRAAGAKFISEAAHFAAAEIVHLSSLSVIAVDRVAREVIFASGQRMAYEKLLLATGARPRQLLQQGAAIPHIDYLRTVDDALAIRERLQSGKRLLLIGAGFIGLELAASARALGVEVTVIEFQPRILMRGLPEEIAFAVHARHSQEGVEIITGAAIASVETGPGAARVMLSDGRILCGDILVAGIGAVPATELAQGCGLGIDNGIAVDERLASTDSRILAAGDCCSYPLDLYGGRRVRLESWRNAQEQGALAARNMLGAAEAVSAVPWFWSDQYELGLQVCGLADGSTNAVCRDLGNGAFLLFHLAADGTLLAASGIGFGNAVAKDIKLAELLIGRRARPEAGLLALPDVKLKSLLT